LIFKLIPFKKLRSKLISNNFYLNQINKAYMVAAISGGDSFSDIYGLGRLFYGSLPQLLVLLVGKKLVLLPQTIGPFKGKYAQIIGRYIINKADVVYSRDHAGLQEAKDLLHPEDRSEKFKFCYDVGFVVEPIKPRETGMNDFLFKKDSSRFIVGLNVSGLLYMGGYTRKNMFGLKIDYKKLIYDVIDFFISEKNLSVLLVPHVFGYGENSESDSVVCEKIYEELKTRYPDRLFFVKGTYNQSEIKYIIGMCDFFVGSRMHACIAALSQCIPAVAIAYSKKFSGVFESIGVGHLVADPRIMNERQIVDVIENAFEDRQNIKEGLQKMIPQVKKEILSIFA
jgi:colanic acid/amylovoran biosynthesis protein